ncbi:related to oxidoreductase, short-chain dehydrogenase/reductase family [Ramularia collo-cygni]|uniref:Related to oxidoreductase, short-chain dehydrogenase/reductase family n=1 Tax=Ramularia collo-cygni TaxID=112498 RepID=A0A2D3V6W8_9PEZI|nr:related to oxidoreductase, short-chain dehydrogenase/reductase family [Ramularia collo-cygni]CZT25156.1 related to oxidoreductase, short-chain dehydrogenase/reductase family [Ramularia collo-cygni]
MATTTFDPAKDIPNLKGKVLIITGGTAGIGRATVLSFAAHQPAHIIFTGRSQPSAEAVISESSSEHPSVPVTFIKCDLASLSSIQTAARQIVSKVTRIDILIANAGVMALPQALTEDGYEIQFCTNFLGHALLVKLLTPLMQTTARIHGDVRIVWDSSIVYMIHPLGGIQFDTLQTIQADMSPTSGNWIRYSQSKLANLLYARAFAKHHPEITSVAIHPGIAYTGLIESLSWAERIFVKATTFWMAVPPDQCAYNQQWAATAPLGGGIMQVESGRYYEPVGRKAWLLRRAGDDGLAEKLWEWTQEELKPFELAAS